MTNKLLDVKLRITHKDGKPQLEVRRRITDPEIIKTIISCALNGNPVVVHPTFTNYLNGINSLIEKGIIYPIKNPDNSISYEFVI